MAKLFSVASWNVEHFRNDNARVDRVVQFLRAQKPDVFALYEVEGAEVFEELVKRMPEWHFHITEGPQVQEILIGVKRTMTAFCTQRIEFNSGIQTLRPGALVTLHAGGQYYPMLFLHTKSAATRWDWASATTCSTGRWRSGKSSTARPAARPTTSSSATSTPWA